jgi:HD-GYP domain-containing protein (c-di-GMP phosphodiesterase class II)
MNEQARTNQELIEEISILKQRNLELEQSEAEHKRVERRQYLAAEILGILNDPSALANSINLVQAAIKRETSFDAVGIRLRSGDDFPYFVQSGFSHDFLLTENTLIARDASGGFCRDENGNISLECTCGLVISGQTDPTNPLFTERGSSWTNNSLPFLDLPSEQDPRLHPRNKCIHQGYLSVALIPLRAKREIVGLLQLNDRRKDCFTLAMIHFFEGIGDSIGIALMRKRLEDALRAEEDMKETLKRLRKAVGVTIQVMVSTVETRDPYTAGHQIRSANLARAIAKEMGLPPEKIDGIRMAGSIHDIGKLSIPAEILSKPTKLTNIEFSLIKEHSRSGYEILKGVESPWPLAEIVYQHHERMDGSGYPRNLKGDDILMEARILAVSDVVESMASHRPYRPALGIDAALNEIEKNRGTQYDNTVVDACLRLFREKGYQLEQT